MCVTWQIDMCVIMHLCVWYYSFIRVTWLIHWRCVSGSTAACDMARLRRDIYIIYMCDTILQVSDMTHWCPWRDSFVCVTWRMCTCDMTYLYMWHDSLIYVTWLMHICDMNQSFMQNESFTPIMRLICRCDMTYSYVWHDSFVCATEILHIYVRRLLHIRESFIYVTWLINVLDVTHLCVRSLVCSVT